MFIGTIIGAVTAITLLFIIAAIAKNSGRYKRPLYLARSDEIAWGIAMAMSHRIWLYGDHKFIKWIDWDLGLIESRNKDYPLLTGDIIYTPKKWGGYWVSVYIGHNQATLIGTSTGATNEIQSIRNRDSSTVCTSERNIIGTD